MAVPLPRQNVKLNISVGNYFADAFLSEFQWLEHRGVFRTLFNLQDELFPKIVNDF